MSRVHPPAPGTGPLGPVQICDLYERKARALARRPGLAATEHHGLVRFSASFAGRFDHPTHPLTVDLSPGDGGSGTGPNPFDLAIAGLCACYGTCARIWAARARLELLDLNVGVRVEHDARGSLIADPSVAATWRRVFVETTVRVPDSTGRPALEEVFATTAARCPLLANLHPEIERVFLLTIEELRAAKGTAVPSDITP